MKSSLLFKKHMKNIQTLGEQIYENLKHKNVNAVQKIASRAIAVHRWFKRIIKLV